MKLSGVMPALATPFDAEGNLDFKAFEKLLTSLRAAGVTGWVPCGSTGEYNFLSDAEREEVLKFVKAFARPGEMLIAGTNAPHTKGVIANTQRAKEIGYEAVLLSTPFYTKPSQQELIRHFNTVLDAVDINIVLYSYWPDRHFVPNAVRDYCMFAVPSSAGGGAMVTGAGGR